MLRRISLSLFTAIIAVLALMPGALRSVEAQQPPPPCVRYGAFSRNVSYIVAQREGFFTEQGLTA